MARNVTITCDLCKKPTERIVAKLHYVPMIPGVNRGVHSNYTHHLDVGECCKEKLFKSFNFRKRMTAEEYKQHRRANGKVK